MSTNNKNLGIMLHSYSELSYKDIILLNAMQMDGYELYIKLDIKCSIPDDLYDGNIHVVDDFSGIDLGYLFAGQTDETLIEHDMQTLLFKSSKVDLPFYYMCSSLHRFMTSVSILNSIGLYRWSNLSTTLPGMKEILKMHGIISNLKETFYGKIYNQSDLDSARMGSTVCCSSYVPKIYVQGVFEDYIKSLVGALSRDYYINLDNILHNCARDCCSDTYFYKICINISGDGEDTVYTNSIGDIPKAYHRMLNKKITCVTQELYMMLDDCLRPYARVKERED